MKIQEALHLKHYHLLEGLFTHTWVLGKSLPRVRVVVEGLEDRRCLEYPDDFNK